MEYIVFHIEGGIGKNIMATAVAKVIKRTYPNKELIISTAWEEVWFNNPYISRVYKLGTLSYFYDDFIKDRDTLIFMYDPYYSQDYIYKKKHLISIWCELFGLEYKEESPELFISPREIDVVKNTIIKDTTKPIFVIQTNGGVASKPYSWARDLPLHIAQEIVNNFSKEYTIFHIKYENQLFLQNTISLTAPLRQVLITILLSNKRLLIDSFGQHAAAAFNLPSTVTWVVNNPKVLGYNIHDNILSDIEEKYKTTKYSYLEPYNISGIPHEYPYDTRDLFNIDNIIESLNKPI